MYTLHIQEFEITDEIRELGFTRIYATGKTLVLKNTITNSGIHCPFYKDDIVRTTKGIRESLTRHGNSLDEETITKLCALFAEVWLASVEAEAEEARITQMQVRNQKENIRDQIKQLKDVNAGISSDDWISKLKGKYQNLREVVERNIPELWSGLEFELSVLRILNIERCTLPFIGIILGRPSSSKTAIISLLRKWPSDNFTAKAFVSHSTAVASKEDLAEIDMLPKIKNKLFLTPELSPMFSAKLSYDRFWCIWTERV